MMRPRPKRRPIAEINVVPYIDVMLVLLVIFMITTPLLMQGVHVHLPKAHAKKIASEKQMPLVVSIDQRGQYYLNVSAHPKAPLSAVALMSQVAARLKLAQTHHEKQPIYVKGDRDVDYGKVVHAMVLLQRAGAQDVGLMTDPSH